MAELIHYLRGRSRDDIIERLREGAREAGVEDVPVYADELAALQAMIAQREDAATWSASPRSGCGPRSSRGSRPAAANAWVRPTSGAS